MQEPPRIGYQMLPLGEAEIRVAAKLAAQLFPAALVTGGQISRGLVQGEAEKLAEAILLAFQIIKPALCFDGQGFLQANPLRGRLGAGGGGLGVRGSRLWRDSLWFWRDHRSLATLAESCSKTQPKYSLCKPNSKIQALTLPAILRSRLPATLLGLLRSTVLAAAFDTRAPDFSVEPPIPESDCEWH